MSEKMSGRFTGFSPCFTCIDARANVLWSYDYEKKDGVEVVEGVRYFVRPSVKLRSPSGSFSPGIDPPKHVIFIF